MNIGWTGEYKCIDRNIVDPLNGVFSVFSDAYSMVIPLLIVSRLTVPANRKRVLYVVFCCGLIVLGAGIARTIYLARLYTDPRRDQTCTCYSSVFICPLPEAGSDSRYRGRSRSPCLG